MLVGYVFVGTWMLAAGIVGTWLWLRGDVNHYKDLYEKVVREKKELQVEYNNRLDALGKALETDTTYVTFGMPIFTSGSTEPSAASDEDSEYEYE